MWKEKKTSYNSSVSPSDYSLKQQSMRLERQHSTVLKTAFQRTLAHCEHPPWQLTTSWNSSSGGSDLSSGLHKPQETYMQANKIEQNSEHTCFILFFKILKARSGGSGDEAGKLKDEASLCDSPPQKKQTADLPKQTLNTFRRERQGQGDG